MNEEKPRILFVMHLPPPVHGASMMGQYIYESQLVNSKFDCHYVNLTIARNLEDVGKGGIRKLIAFLKKDYEILRAIRKVKPDWIYITPNSANGPFYKDFVVVQLCKLLCKHVVSHFHNKGVQTRQEHWLDDKLYRQFFKGVKVMLLADCLYNDVEKYVCKSDVLVCPNGIPNDVSIEVNSKSENDVPHILWLTNMMRTKGLVEFLDALKILKDKQLSFHVDFIGGFTNEISEEEFNQIVLANGLSDVIVYHGKKYGAEKDSFFRNADMFVLPSYTEAFPLTILEAMKYGLPVVATNVGGINAEVKDGVNGLLIGGQEPILRNDFVPDPKEIAEKIEQLLMDKALRTSMGKAGYKAFINEFSLEAFEARFVKTLEDLIKD